MRVDIEPETQARIDALLAASEAIAPVSTESVVHMALDAFLEGAGF